LMIRLAELQGNADEALRLRRMMEIKATDESLHELLKRIWALEDEARALQAVRDKAQSAYDALTRAVDAEKKKIDEAYDARMRAIDAERNAAQEAHQANMDAINAQLSSAQEALSIAQGTLSTIQSALSTMRGQQPVDELSRARASRSLSQMAASGRLPEQEALEKILAVLLRTEEQDFQTEAEYLKQQQATTANLLKLEKAGLREVDQAEQAVSRLDQMIEDATRRHQDHMDALDDQQRTADEWRDAELERLDGILSEARKRLDALLGIDTTLLSIEEAMRRFFDSLPEEAAGGAMVTEPLSGANQPQVDEMAALRAEVVLLRKDLAAIHTAQVVPLKGIEDRLRAWDGDGLPGPRDSSGSDSETVVLLRAG